MDAMWAKYRKWCMLYPDPALCLMCYLSAYILARSGQNSLPSGVCKERSVVSLIYTVYDMTYLGNVVDSYSSA